MRNEGHDDTENAFGSVVARRARWRKQALVGATGLALLGAGSFAVTTQVSDDGRAEIKGIATISPAASPTGGDKRSASVKAPASATSRPKTTKELIAAAHELASKPNNRVRRPLPPQNGNTVGADEVRVTDIGSLKRDKATLRVVSARRDLTGLRELSWVADAGEKFGSARCTQKIRLSAGAAALVKPTLLLCWRTSADKSVYTLAVNVAERPSKKASVAALDKEWSKLG
jgi:hypothetical protein